MWGTVVAGLLATAALGGAVPAAPKSKVVLALIAAAQKEFDAGSFERAGELFLEIWHQDPTTQPAIYNAARAYQLAGRIDRADELFRELLAVPDMDAVLKGKAQTQLDTLQAKRAERKADEADRAEKANQYVAAAGLWGEAIALLPAKSAMPAGKIAWLLRHARALHLGGQLAPAQAAYDRYLAATSESSPDRAQVVAWKQELTQALQPAVEPPAAPVAPSGAVEAPAPTVAVAPSAPVTPPVVVAPPSTVPPVQSVVAPTPEPSRTVPLLALAGGGALAVAGVAVVALASRDETTLRAHQGPDGKVKGISLADYTAQADAISGRYRIGWTLTGLGVVGAGVGTWLWLSAPQARAALVPTWGGVAVAGRF